MSAKRKNIIIICKQRLISIDSILPLLLEINKREANLNFFFIAPDKKHYELIKRQYHIMNCIEQIGGKFLFQPRKNRWSLYLWTIMLFIKLSFKTNVFFSGGACILKHDFFLYWLKKISKTIEFRFSFLAPTPDFITNLNIHQIYMAELSGEAKQKSVKNRMTYNYFLSSMPYNAVKYLVPESIPKNKFMELGYVRSFPEWLKFSSQAANVWHASHKKKYCLFILSTFGIRLDLYDEPPLLDLFKETLQVLKSFSPDLHIVFKPHAITDMKIFKETVDALELSNYSVDYGHPMVLSKNAEFIIGNCFSNTMYDAFFLGCPVVEYASYDPGLLKRINNKSSGGICCDYFISRDKKKLEKILNHLMKTKESHVHKTYIQKYFQGYPERFYQLFDKFLG